MDLNSSACTEWLFSNLQKHNPSTGESCPGIKIPQTVLYRWSKPYMWYFTDGGGKIHHVSKKKVDHDRVQEEFDKQQQDPRCVFLSFTDHSATLEYITPVQFSKFINTRTKPARGLIQEWIPPKSEHNSLIKVDWTAEFCFIEQRTNKHSIHNPRLSIYEKLMTYEGYEHLSEVKRLTRSSIQKQIRVICSNIYEHLKSVGPNNITKMVLYFKQDHSNKLWLFFCSYLRVLHTTKWNKIFGGPHELMLKIPTFARQNEFLLPCVCPSCGAGKKPEEMHNIPHKMIIAKETGSGVPEVVSRIDPGIEENVYRKLKKSTEWLLRTAKVCGECYLSYTQNYLEPKIKNVPHIEFTKNLPTFSDLSHDITLNSEEVQKPKFTAKVQYKSLAKIPIKPVIVRKRETKTCQEVEKKPKIKTITRAVSVYGKRLKSRGSYNSTFSDISNIFDVPNDIKDIIIKESLHSLKEAVLKISS